MIMTEEPLYLCIHFVCISQIFWLGFASDECTKAERTGSQCGQHTEGYRSPKGILVALDFGVLC